MSGGIRRIMTRHEAGAARRFCVIVHKNQIMPVRGKAETRSNLGEMQQGRPVTGTALKNDVVASHTPDPERSVMSLSEHAHSTTPSLLSNCQQVSTYVLTGPLTECPS
jgi:hypothetical protein